MDEVEGGNDGNDGNGQEEDEDVIQADGTLDQADLVNQPKVAFNQPEVNDNVIVNQPEVIDNAIINLKLLVMMWSGRKSK